MTPIDYVSREEAIELVAAAKFAGEPDRDVVRDLRQQGVNVADGVARDDAIAEIWKAVDQNQLEAHIYGPGDRWLKMSPLETAQVPLLRGPRGGDFTFLRPRNSFYRRVTAEFGLEVGLLELVFRREQVEKLARSMRRRKRRNASPESGTPMGRPNRRDQVQDSVRQMIEENQWDTSKPLKALVQLVQRSLKWDKGLSESTIARALYELWTTHMDRRFFRRRRISANTKLNLAAEAGTPEPITNRHVLASCRD